MIEQAGAPAPAGVPTAADHAIGWMAGLIAIVVATVVLVLTFALVQSTGSGGAQAAFTVADIPRVVITVIAAAVIGAAGLTVYGLPVAVVLSRNLAGRTNTTHAIAFGVCGLLGGLVAAAVLSHETGLWGEPLTSWGILAWLPVPATVAALAWQQALVLSR